MRVSEPLEHLETIFSAALRRVDPFKMIMDHVHISKNLLHINLKDNNRVVDLSDYSKIFVIGAGKATAPMAMAFERILGNRITKGVIVVKYGHTKPLKHIEIIEAGHPEPDASGLAGARKIMELAQEADSRTLVITLISGGGSALLTLPVQVQHNGLSLKLTLAHKQEVTRKLLRCGADIREINCIRKHLSAIKGGRLAHSIVPGTNISFILSDVVGDDLSSIASGPTSADPTTYKDALNIIKKYEIYKTIPEVVCQIIEMGAKKLIPDTPGISDVLLEKSCNILIGSNKLAMHAAGEKAQSLGYSVVYLTSRISGEARDVAKLLAGIAVDTAESGMLSKAPVCIISGGEPVVTIQGNGKGGRNQEMSLAFLDEIRRNPDLFDKIFFLAASTDGNDGPTDAAGAFASKKLLKFSLDNDLSIEDFLKNNDSYNFFDKIKGLLKTGPTNTNVCDLHITLVM